MQHGPLIQNPRGRPVLRSTASTILLGASAEDTLGCKHPEEPTHQWWEGSDGGEREGQAQRNKGASGLYGGRSEPSRLGCLRCLHWSFITLVLC